MCPSSPSSPSTQRRQRRGQRVELEKNFLHMPRPCPRSRTPCFIHHVPSPPAHAPPSTLLPSLSLQVVRAWRQGQGHRSHQGETIPDTATNVGRQVRQ